MSGYPSLQKAREAANEVQRALGFPNLRKAVEKARKHRLAHSRINRISTGINLLGLLRPTGNQPRVVEPICSRCGGKVPDDKDLIFTKNGRYVKQTENWKNIPCSCKSPSGQSRMLAPSNTKLAIASVGYKSLLTKHVHYAKHAKKQKSKLLTDHQGEMEIDPQNHVRLLSSYLPSRKQGSRKYLRWNCRSHGVRRITMTSLLN